MTAMRAPRYAGRETPALVLLRDVARTLGPLTERVVFIGGSIAPLLQTHPIAPAVRPTKDVDGLAMIISYADYHDLQATLRALGFAHSNVNADPTGHAHR